MLLNREEVAQASDQDASHTPLYGGILGAYYWEETLGRPITCWWDYISHLACTLGFPRRSLKLWRGRRILCFACCHCNQDSDNQQHVEQGCVCVWVNCLFLFIFYFWKGINTKCSLSKSLHKGYCSSCLHTNKYKHRPSRHADMM